jgi:hypothetical protein
MYIGFGWENLKERNCLDGAWIWIHLAEDREQLALYVSSLVALNVWNLFFVAEKILVLKKDAA